MKTNSSKFCVWILFTVILICGGIVRFHGLGDFSMWYDEVGEAFVAHQPVGEMVEYIRTDLAAMPVNYLLLWGSYHLGDSDFWGRFPAALMGSLSILLLFLIVTKLTDEQTGLIASFLLAISPLAIYYSKETRPYSLLMFVTLLQVGSYLWYAKRPSWTRGFILFACVAFALHSHFYSWMVTAFLCLNILVIPRLRDLRAFFCLVIACISLLPWIMGMDIRADYLQTIGYTNTPSFDFRTFNEIRIAFFGVHPLTAIVGVFLVALGLWTAVRDRKWIVPWILVQGSVLLGVVLWGDSQVQYFLSARQLIFLVPLMCLLVAAGIRELTNIETPHRLIGVGVAVFWCFLFVFTQKEDIKIAHFRISQDWKNAIQYVVDESDPGDMIMTHPGWWGYCTDHYMPSNFHSFNTFGFNRMEIVPESEFSGHHLWWLHYHPHTSESNPFKKDPRVEKCRQFIGGITVGRCVEPLKNREHLVELIAQRLEFSVLTTWKDPPQEFHIPEREKSDLEYMYRRQALFK